MENDVTEEREVIAGGVVFPESTMSSPNLDTSPKRRCLVHLAITESMAAQRRLIRPDSMARRGAGEPNARICGYTESSQHLANNFQRIHSEVTASPTTHPLVHQIQTAIGDLVPFQKLQ